MTQNNEDILIELSEDELKELADLYSTHKNDVPHIHSFLQTCIKSKEINMKDYVSVFSPRNCWREDGTFFASMPSFGHDIVLHSLDKTGKNLFDGLLKTNRFHFHPDPARNNTLFYAVHENFTQKISEILTQKWKHNKIEIDKTNLWYLEKNEAEKLEIMPSGEVYVKELESTDIPVVVSKWPYRYPAAECKFAQWLKLQKGFGVYLKANNEMVSWVLSSCLGQMAALHTKEEHTNKGYASMVVTKMAKYLMEKSSDTCATVMEGNIASEKLFQKLKFKILYKCDYIVVYT